MYFSNSILDDLLHRVFEKLLSSKQRLIASRGEFTELPGVLLQLTNPRARLSQTEKRGKIFSGLGELLWYLSGTNSVHFIKHYASRYEKECEDGKTIYGGYGPRLLNWKRGDMLVQQIEDVLKLLREKCQTRRAVIQLFDAADIAEDHKEIPCTCTLQFMIRRQRLHMFTTMRSNDVFLGLPHDVFAFTMLQEIMARTLGVELGKYKHFAASLHLYTRDFPDARQYLNEGWQPTNCAEMPPMPIGDPWPTIKQLLQFEDKIRRGGKLNAATLGLDAYWADLVRLLQIHYFAAKKKPEPIDSLKRAMSSKVYHPYIDRRRQRVVRHGEHSEQLRLL